MLHKLTFHLLFLAAPALAQQAAAVPDAPFSVSHLPGLQAHDDGWRGGGRDYRAWFDAAGVRFEPALGELVAETQHVGLAFESLRRGGEPLVAPNAQVRPLADGLRVVYPRGQGIDERFDVGAGHVALSWRFAARPAGGGDLVVRYALDTSLPTPVERDGGVAFLLPERGGVTIGGVTGIDARGRECAGTTRLVGGALELSLPAAFVDAAAYPLVLDPLIGTAGVVGFTANAEEAPDVCYDSSSDRFLVVWETVFSASSREIRGALVSNATGTAVGGAVFLPSVGVATHARVAAFSTRGRFGVVWKQLAGGIGSVQFASIDAATGALGNASTIVWSSGDLFFDPDIGSEPLAPIDGDRAFVVVYEDDVADAIRANRLYWTANDTFVVESAQTIWADSGGSLGSNYMQPAISRAAGPDGLLLIVFRGETLSIATDYIYAWLVSSASLAQVASQTLDAQAAVTLRVPEVDGASGRWTAAWAQQVDGSAYPSVSRRAGVYDPVAQTLSFNQAQTFGGGLAARIDFPTLAYAPGRTWFGYRRGSLLGESLRMTGIDTNSCDDCSDVFSRTISTTADTRIVTATTSSGGAFDGERALCVFGDSGEVYGQWLRNHGINGTTSNVGGGCGNGGDNSVGHAPGIGSSALRCRVDNLPPTALLTVFNFAVPVGALPCGSCAWTPFEVTVTLPVFGGGAEVSFPLPCLPALVGAQFETQWTSFDPTAAPCPLFPGLILTDRLLLTLGD